MVGTQNKNAQGYPHARGGYGRGIKDLRFALLNAQIRWEMMMTWQFRVLGV